MVTPDMVTVPMNAESGQDAVGNSVRLPVSSAGIGLSESAPIDATLGPAARAALGSLQAALGQGHAEPNLGALTGPWRITEHANGTCQPCLFFASQHGCVRGDVCEYCHLEHQANSSPRPRKQTRDKIKERVLRIFRENSSNLHDELQAEARWHPYAVKITQGFLEDEIPITWEEFEGLEARWRPAGLIFSL